MFNQNWKIKLKETLGSQNFLVSIIAVVLMALKANGVVDEDINPEEVLVAFAGVIDIITAYVITPIVKIIKGQLAGDKWSWDFLKSTNFITMVSTVAVLIVGVFLGEQTAALIVSLVMNFLNIGYHVKLPAKYT